jgi:hypothetical protein
MQADNANDMRAAFLEAMGWTTGPSFFDCRKFEVSCLGFTPTTEQLAQYQNFA